MQSTILIWNRSINLLLYFVMYCILNEFMPFLYWIDYSMHGTNYPHLEPIFNAPMHTFPCILYKYFSIDISFNISWPTLKASLVNMQYLIRKKYGFYNITIIYLHWKNTTMYVMYSMFNTNSLIFIILW